MPNRVSYLHLMGKQLTLQHCYTELLVPAVRLPTTGRRAFLVASARTWTGRTGRHHLSTISARLQKATKTASVSTFISWPNLV